MFSSIDSPVLVCSFECSKFTVLTFPSSSVAISSKPVSVSVSNRVVLSLRTALSSLSTILMKAASLFL